MWEGPRHDWLRRCHHLRKVIKFHWSKWPEMHRSGSTLCCRWESKRKVCRECRAGLSRRARTGHSGAKMKARSMGNRLIFRTWVRHCRAVPVCVLPSVQPEAHMPKQQMPCLYISNNKNRHCGRRIPRLRLGEGIRQMAPYGKKHDMGDKKSAINSRLQLFIKTKGRTV